ncbi:sel1 repeat family protein [Geomonas sp. Red32]|uniref:tetratricopeptide repeat protein n=1 Tax=Geomonas sp. Red32 TaxID=2912856 RepID=UPI00202D0D26|nr:tetratricopeptide repeat protein [Geomonas sp. Red32]MCM0080198.1 sel1 repeat family protein [Geomonas sp. Red32]
MTDATRHNVIDFRQKAKELRIKHVSKKASAGVSDLEAERAEALGLLHLMGEGGAWDPEKAAGYLATAAKAGRARAQHELGLLHLQGTGVPHDVPRAVELLESAWQGGHAASVIALAELFIFGEHCQKDIERALDLLYEVVFDGETAAMYYLAYIYDRDAGHHNPFEAAYWYRRAAEYGHFKSQIRLACLYAVGQGVPRCLETAEGFLQAAMKSTDAQDPKFLYWQGARLGETPETEFLGQALIKAAAAMKYTPAQRFLMEHGWRANSR